MKKKTKIKKEMSTLEDSIPVSGWAVPNVPVNYTDTKTIQKTVEEVVETVIPTATVQLRGINIRIMPDQKILLLVDWAWLDENQKVIRQGIRRFTEEQIAAKLEANGSSLEAIRQLFMTMTQEDAQTPD
mgnify:FL=1